MRVTADTNLLVRAITEDDPAQSAIAQRCLAEAELIALTLPTLCELCWVLDRAYGLGRDDIGRAISVLTMASNVAADRLAVEAGLAMLAAGGDFADGVIAHCGQWLGGEVLISFDRKAVRRLEALGVAAQVPA